MDLLFGNLDWCLSSGKALFVPHDATWHIFCSTSALRTRFQVGLFVVFDEDGVGLGTSGVVKVFGGRGSG